MQKVIYVAGPVRDHNTGPDGAYNYYHQLKNCRVAEQISWEVWKAGGAPICPHMNTLNYQGSLPDKIWLDGDISILLRCDALLVCPGWENSSGTKAEIQAAEEADIPVFYYETYTDDDCFEAFLGFLKS